MIPAVTAFLEAFSLERLRRWGLKGGLAVADQGLFSGSNFMLNVLLARWLGATGYGAFSLAFALYLFCSGIYNAIVLEPISVFGTGKYSDQLRAYLSGQIAIHIIVCGVLGAAAAAAGLAMLQIPQIDRILSLAIVGMGAFLPFMLLLWLARRACYVYGKPEWAVCASMIYSLILLGAVLEMSHLASISNMIVVFAAMGIASFAGSLCVYAFMHFGSITNGHLYWRNLLTEQWIFGQWIMLAAFLNFAGTQIQLFISAALLGLGAAGVLSALQNFMLPMMQTVTAIATLGLPSIAFEFGKKNYTGMKRRSFRISGVLVVLSIGYAVVLLLFAAPLEHLSYAGRFAKYAWLIPITGVIPLFAAIETGFSLIVRSLRRPVYYAVFTGLMAVVGVTSGLFFIAHWGIGGAVFGLVAVALASMIANISFYQYWFLPLAKQP